MSTELWEILVPTVRRSNGRPYRVRYHRVWDSKVREITGGLTILTPTKGQWLGPSGDLFAERMIPVRVATTEDKMLEIAHMTKKYYDQLAVMFYRISNKVSII